MAAIMTRILAKGGSACGQVMGFAKGSTPSYELIALDFELREQSIEIFF